MEELKITYENESIGKETTNYNLTIGGILLWGFVVNIIMCVFCADYFLEMNYRVIILGYFVSAITGIIMVESSKNPVISFIGYNLVVLPVGMILSLVVGEYYIGTIINTCIATGMIVIIMMILAVIKPNVFLSMGRILFTSLSSLLIIETIMILLGVFNSELVDVVAATIFTAYIGFDWAIAQSKEKTLDNAVDSAAKLYLDIINLFIRLLGSKKRK